MKLDIQEYLSRIRYRGEIYTNEQCLKELHKCHVMSIPFEALDIHFGKRIDLALERVFEKVITHKRGGYCYELNYLFHWLLSALGFNTQIISSRIFDGEKYGPEYDHMSIVVRLKDEWLVDVGFGDLFIEPIKIKPEIEQIDTFKKYKIEKLNAEDYLLLESLKTKVDFKKRYLFNLKPREIHEFEQQNEFKQFSNESYFVKNRICTIPTKTGRKTIFNNAFKVKTGDKSELIEIANIEELKRILNDEFEVSISGV